MDTMVPCSIFREPTANLSFGAMRDRLMGTRLKSPRDSFMHAWRTLVKKKKVGKSRVHICKGNHAKKPLFSYASILGRRCRKLLFPTQTLCHCLFNFSLCPRPHVRMPHHMVHENLYNRHRCIGPRAYTSQCLYANLPQAKSLEMFLMLVERVLNGVIPLVIIGIHTPSSKQSRCRTNGP